MNQHLVSVSTILPLPQASPSRIPKNSSVSYAATADAEITGKGFELRQKMGSLRYF
ncbi:hypothetical protein K402DRAFT_391401 [Aulographum hederae CBS 113979]|uniref:Uncharacterized protein n=1 Tax=Aulographum hederae CBS 113979 TaxID=1176131 RepID=A0A6G1H6U9_9PEZI|nr:hypothetical protein K402DRAFT_391401 [Aulographum hederae CBS 113979]